MTVEQTISLSVGLILFGIVLWFYAQSFPAGYRGHGYQPTYHPTYRPTGPAPTPPPGPPPVGPALAMGRSTPDVPRGRRPEPPPRPPAKRPDFEERIFRCPYCRVYGPPGNCSQCGAATKPVKYSTASLVNFQVNIRPHDDSTLREAIEREIIPALLRSFPRNRTVH